MSEVYRSVHTGGEGEIEEKKSRFIAHISPVRSVDEANEFIAEMKKKYWDARHNCSAFVIGEDGGISRSSDDGEPSGTAGKPMLEVLKKEGLTDVCAVVTRYFGGVLLGTGGLIRAYTAAVKAGLEDCVLMEKQKGVRLFVDSAYSDEGKLRTFFKSRELPLLDTLYSGSVRLVTVVRLSEAEIIEKEIISLSDGRAAVIKDERITFAIAGDEVLLFD